MTLYHSAIDDVPVLVVSSLIAIPFSISELTDALAPVCPDVGTETMLLVLIECAFV